MADKAGRETRFYLMGSGHVINLDQVELIYNAAGDDEGPPMIVFISGRKIEIPEDDLKNLEIFNGPTWTD